MSLSVPQTLKTVTTAHVNHYGVSPPPATTTANPAATLVPDSHTMDVKFDAINHEIIFEDGQISCLLHNGDWVVLTGHCKYALFHERLFSNCNSATIRTPSGPRYLSVSDCQTLQRWRCTRPVRRIARCSSKYSRHSGHNPSAHLEVNYTSQDGNLQRELRRHDRRPKG